MNMIFMNTLDLLKISHEIVTIIPFLGLPRLQWR